MPSETQVVGIKDTHSSGVHELFSFGGILSVSLYGINYSFSFPSSQPYTKIVGIVDYSCCFMSLIG